MSNGNEPRDVQAFGDSVRLRHSGHFEECATTGQWSGLFFDYLYRDVEPYLLAALRELEIRARRTLRGARCKTALDELYQRQDKQTDRLVALFLSCCSGESPDGIGFGHVGNGRMGITEPAAFERHIQRFSDAVWTEIMVEAGWR